MNIMKSLKNIFTYKENNEEANDLAKEIKDSIINNQLDKKELSLLSKGGNGIKKFVDIYRKNTIKNLLKKK